MYYDGIIPLWGLRIDNGENIPYTNLKGAWFPVKIAVLFGSFNPITNAHVAILKAAMAHIGADRGLFVATNGQYLKKKAVKIGDPFYLTEDERRETIEGICAGEDNLGFGCFELGGINPSRYRTLCKIQKQYPDAQLYEVMGADKVHTLYKSAHAEDYLSRIHFAVFARSDIDTEQMFAEHPVLEAHRSSFVMLPALPDTAAISSTEVRRRFCAGEDYTDLVPVASAAVLARHTPSDFSISFPERMKVMLKDGRFGANNARKEVYKVNTALFRQWQDGTCPIDFGDYQAFLDGTKLYKDAYSVAEMGTVYPHTVTGCAAVDCVDLAERLIEQGYNPAILNLASATKPGGGYRDGMGAQEESLCRSSNLSLSLYQYSTPKYINIRESGVPIKYTGYPLDMHFGGVYTPGVTFFRHREPEGFALRERTFTCDVMTVAALSFNGRSHYASVDELDFRSAEGGFTPEGEQVMLDKIRTIFRMGVEHGKDALVLGAFGCGAYRLPVPEVARLFRVVMEEPEFAGKFRLVTFAILEKKNRPSGIDGKYAAFYREFGALEM